MASITAIGINQLVSGDIVRVSLAPANARLFNFVPVTEGLFRVSTPQERIQPTPLNTRELRRFVSFTRRQFRAVVILNQVSERRLRFEILRPRKPTLYYHLVVPYSKIFRLSRLVRQALTNLSPEQEEARRRRLRTREAAENAYTHPTSRFVPVRMINLPEVFEVSFLFTVPTTGSSWTVAIPPAQQPPDKTYGVQATLADIPGGGSFAQLQAPTGQAHRLVNQFSLRSDVDLLAGTTVEITVRDRI